MRVATRFPLFIGLFLLVFRKLADLGEAARRCATAAFPKDLPNFGRMASLSAFSSGVSLSFGFSPLLAAFLAAAYLLYLTYLPGLSLLPEPEGFWK